MLLKIFEFLRIGTVVAAFYLGYSIGWGSGTYDPQIQLHFMIPIVVVAIAGISGMEGLFFGRAAAEVKGYETGSNYQRQSAIALLSYAFIALFIYAVDWGIRAELTVLFTFLFFFFFSGINHLVDAIRRHNYKWQNINRPFITLMLIAGFFYPVMMALSAL